MKMEKSQSAIGVFKTLSLTAALLAAACFDASANGCSGSYFTISYSPFCACYQICAGSGNAFLISDCDDITDLAFDWGDGTVIQVNPSGQLPCHTYQNPGTYTVTMIVEGYCHSIFSTQTCRISQTLVVSNIPPNFNANFAADTVCLGEPMSFTSLSTFPAGSVNQNWIYNWGDGTPLAIGYPNETHTYAQCGAYDAMLIVTAETPCCGVVGRDTMIKRVYVNCPPNADSNPLGDSDPYIYENYATVNSNAVCLGGTTNFTLTKHDSITYWNYTFADGGSSQQLNPSHVYQYCLPFIPWARVEMTNTRGCTSTLNHNAVVHCPVFANYSGTTSVLCAGDCNGTATINITGGTGPYDIDWSNGQTSLTANNLCIGSYTVTVTDANTCSATQTLTVYGPNPFIGTLSAVDIACYSWATGTAVLIMNGGTPANTFYWSPNGATTQNNSGLTPGTYCVTATDANGCTWDSCVTITQPAQINASTLPTNSNCGVCDGSATVINATGGTGGYNYAWSNGNTGATATALCSGTYFVSVEDAAVPGCSRQFPVSIGNIGAEPVNVSKTDVTCANICNGSATATPVNACSGCAYEWLDILGTSINQNSSTAMNLCAGTYTSRITNPSGCQTLTNVTIVVPNPVVPSTTPVGITCVNATDGQITAFASGGTPTYTYQWFNSSNTPIPGGNPITALAAGTYYVQATDQNGCTARDTAVVASYFFTGNRTFTPISCNGDCNSSITASATGDNPPFTYVFQDGTGATLSSGPNQIVSNLCTGSYGITVTDASGTCSIVLPSVSITEPPALSVSTSSTDVLCYGDCNGSLSSAASGGTPNYHYQWADSTIAPLAADTFAALNNVCAALYHIQVTDANNCTSPWTPVTVSQPPALEDTLVIVQPHCGNNGLGSIDLTVTGGTGAATYTYSWSNSAVTEDINSLPAGNYDVTITDGNACTLTDGAALIQPPVLSTVVAAPSRNGYEVRCNGGTGLAYVTISGGVPAYDIEWNDPNSTTNDTLFGATAGNYTVTVTDATGCTDVKSITLNEPPPMSISSVPVDIACAGDATGSITTTVSGGLPLTRPPFYAIRWENLSDSTVNLTDTMPTIMGLTAGQYYVFAFDSNACIVRDTIDVAEPLPLQVTFSVVNGTCGGTGTGNGSIHALVSGGTPNYSYAWDVGGNTDSLINLFPGDYILSVTDSRTCSVTDTATVTVPSPLAINIAPTSTLCFGSSDGRVDVTVSGGSPFYYYAWTSLPDTTEDLAAVPTGNYSVLVTDQGGCTITASTFVDQPAPITGTRSVVICSGSSFFVGGANQTNPGAYFDTLASAGGCDSLLRTDLDTTSRFLASEDTTICFGTTLVFGSNTYALAGTYTETLQASGGCDSVVTLTLGILPDIGAIAIPDSAEILVGESVAVTIQSNPNAQIQTYDWSPAIGLNCTACLESANVSPPSSTQYTVAVTDQLGCPDTARFTIIVDSLGAVIYIPNAFTPNGDGSNDVFTIYGSGFTKYHLMIFNRWGELLFESFDQSNGWDGTYRGKALNPGVYVYYADIEFVTGTKPPEYVKYRKGSVTLIR